MGTTNVDPAQQFHLFNNQLWREPEMTNNLTWKKYYPLSDKTGFICLVDHMGDDSSIVQAARVSYGKDEQNTITVIDHDGALIEKELPRNPEQQKKDRQLIRYLMNHQHTTPFEMVEFKFMVQVPMDCWRQWIRHRTASVNEYSTRYTEAIDVCQTTPENEWRLQATDNKQGSSGYLDEDLGNLLTVAQAQDLIQFHSNYLSRHKAGAVLSKEESLFHKAARKLYELRLALGIAKEQARKDLPLSTYTRAYWKCDLHNIFNFLRLRMDSHAQLEIRSYANCMYEIVKQVCPVACEAFEDYVLHAKRFSRMEMQTLKILLAKSVEKQQVMEEFSYDETMSREEADLEWHGRLRQAITETTSKPSSMTDREWKEFLAKLS